MSDFKRKKARGFFHLTKEYLYVANDGHPFDREGVLALCLANLSGKGDSIIDRHKNVPDKDWIGEHNQSSLVAYQKDQNRIQADFKNEESTVREYSGRWLFELLQNIDDANGTKDVSRYIGTKGLGFLSILEIAQNPAIFSGNFAFEFSQDKTKEALINLGVGVQQASLAPILHVPWPSEPDKEISLLIGQGYSTVIRFKLKQGFYEDIREVLNNFEYHFMLFSQNLNWLRIKIGKKEKTIESFDNQISGSSLKSKHKIILKTTLPGRKAKTEDWIKWQRNWESTEEIKKRSNCMFCLPLENHKCIPHSTETNVYNFFPTEEPSSIFGFMHVSFNLSRDRKKLQMWGEKQNVTFNDDKCPEENKRLVTETCQLIIDVIDDEMVPAETIIEAFHKLDQFEKVNTKGKPLRETQKKLIKLIKNHAFLPVFGGGLTTCKDALLWENNFIDCLSDTKNINQHCFVAKSIEPNFDRLLVHYDCKDLDCDSVLEIYATERLKNRTKLDRENIAKTIANYATKERFQCPNLESFVKIKFIENSNGSIVSLIEDYFAIIDKVSVPSFCQINYLSDSSQKNFKKYFFNDKNIPANLINRINERLIYSDEDVIKDKLSDIIQRKNFSWKNNGMETLAYLYGFFIKDREKFPDIINNLKRFLRVPDQDKGEWQDISKSYFSQNWLSKPSLDNWYKEHSLPADFQIERTHTFKKKIGQYNDKLFFVGKGKFTKASLKGFLELIGVSKVPRPKKIFNNNKYYFYSKSPEYYALLENCGFNNLEVEWIFSGLDDFLNSQTLVEVLPNIYAMLMYLAEKKAIYTMYRGRKFYYPEQYSNFAHFQLQTTPWIRLNPSPLRPLGVFSPNECYISKTADPVFPTLTKAKFKKFLGTKEVDFLLSKLKISNEFSPNTLNWKTWLNTIPSGYKKMISDGASVKKLNVQIDFFYKSMLSNNFKTPDAVSKLAVKPKNNSITAYDFKNIEKIFWNDSPLEDEIIIKALLAEDLGLFVLGKYAKVDKEKLQDFGISPVSKRLSFIPDYKRLNLDYETEQISFFKKRWNILAALDLEFRKSKSSRQFHELKESLILCDYLKISIRTSDKKTEREISKEALPYFSNIILTNGQFQEKFYVLNNCNNETLLEFICNHFFAWTGRFALLEQLLFKDTNQYQIEKTLKKNGLNPNLISNFEALFSDIEEFKREKEIKESKKDSSQLKNLLKEKNQPDTSKKSNHVQSKNDNTDINKKSIKSNNGKNSSKGSKSINSRSNQKTGFGSRLSGHLRPRNSNEIVGREYFDDEGSPQNKKIGDAAEKIIFEKLKKQPSVEKIQLLGGNNKGYDIEYCKNDVSYFVEVKGLRGSWLDTDVLFSRAQFEKAQEAGDRFSIFVVENVGKGTEQDITEIKDPASFFTKMQLDHGWKNFSLTPEHLQPAVGRILVRNGDKRIIENVQKSGTIFRLVVNGESQKITYNPSNMQIEEPE